jgi:electron transport complex protein RnfC
MRQTRYLTDNLHLSRFHGGLVLDGHKQQSTQHPVSQVKQSTRYVLPLQQHIGVIAQPIVNAGDRVLKGQMIARPGNLISAAIHSPVSGTVIDIRLADVPHVSGLQDTCIIIENDYKDEWIERHPLGDDYNNTSPSDMRKLVRNAGIVGLGGAAFPAAVKQTEVNIRTLVINGVECEPYITCDDMLMRNHAEQVLSGAEIIAHIIKARECIIAIEDNKPEAITAMRAAVDRDTTGFFNVVVVPTIYPSGGEKQLIQVLTGEEVPKDRYPAELDVLCHNVATAYAIYRAVYFDEPLISRLATITGEGVTKPQNVEVLIGTPMADCIEHCGGYTDDHDELIMGGPMMGFAIGNDDTPVTKATNCLLVTTKATALPSIPHLPCIRCGKCVDVCPAQLLPQQLYWYASSKNDDRLQEHNLFDCIECGCCAYVCPSDIPLVQYYRFAKTSIRQKEQQRKHSDIARQRHEAHQARLDKQKLEREEKLRKKRELLKKKSETGTGNASDSKKAAIAEALARAQAKKSARKDAGQKDADQKKNIAAATENADTKNENTSGKPDNNNNVETEKSSRDNT